MPEDSTKQLPTAMQDVALHQKAMSASAARIRRGLWRELGFGRQQHIAVTDPREGQGMVAHPESDARVAVTYAPRDGKIFVAVSGEPGEFDPATDDGLRGLAGAIGDALNKRLDEKTS
jgi:hypothetical protein